MSRGDDIALGLHLIGEVGDGVGGKADEFDAEAAGRCGGDAAGLEGGGEIGGGELVFGVGGAARTDDVDAFGERVVGGGVDLAGDGDEMEGGLRGGEGGEGEEECADAVRVHARDCTGAPGPAHSGTICTFSKIEHYEPPPCSIQREYNGAAFRPRRFAVATAELA